MEATRDRGILEVVLTGDYQMREMEAENGEENEIEMDGGPAPDGEMACDLGITDAVWKLQTLCAKLNGDCAEVCEGKASKSKSFTEGDMVALMSEILRELGNQDELSTIEFEQSGIVSSLLTYFGIRSFSNENLSHDLDMYTKEVIERYKQFIEVSLPLSSSGKEVIFITLVRKLQIALASSELFPEDIKNTSIPDDLWAKLYLYSENDEDSDDPEYSFSNWEYELERYINEGEELPHNMRAHDIVVRVGRDVGMAGITFISQPSYSRDPSTASGFQRAAVGSRTATAGSWQDIPIPEFIYYGDRPRDSKNEDSAYDILRLLHILERLYRLATRLRSQDSEEYFIESGKRSNSTAWQLYSPVVPAAEFCSSKLTSKLDTQMRDNSLAFCAGDLPAWWPQLIRTCPFLFPFEIRVQYFHYTAMRPSRAFHQLRQERMANGHHEIDMEDEARFSRIENQTVWVSRNQILEAAVRIMELYADKNVLINISYLGEIGSGPGPTSEFYVLVSHELRRSALDMWRTDSGRDDTGGDPGTNYVSAQQGLFPRPWASTENSVENSKRADVLKHFRLLGQIMGKALQDGHMLDLPLSLAFYKLVLGKKLDRYDIASIDPELGRTLQEMHLLVRRKQFLEKTMESNSREAVEALRFRDSRIEDLFLDFTLPGYPEYCLKPGGSEEMVNLGNLEDYVSLVVDATLGAGISAQLEAFFSGLTQVLRVSTSQIFTEDEMDLLLCGLQEKWVPDTLPDYLTFRHGYTAKSLPIRHLLEIMGEFTASEQQGFLRFVTAAPKLPSGGLASLTPRLTVVRKDPWGDPSARASTPASSSETTLADRELPRAMTCVNSLTLPPYSSKAVMRDRLMYAIREGQGSFFLP